MWSPMERTQCMGLEYYALVLNSYPDQVSVIHQGAVLLVGK